MKEGLDLSSFFAVSAGCAKDFTWKKINGFWITMFHYIDDERGLLPIETPFQGLLGDYNPDPTRVTRFRLMLSDAFSQAGWEGDGVINCIAIPPFLRADGDCYFGFMFHVKQDNNGTSWLGYPTDEVREFFEHSMT